MKSSSSKNIFGPPEFTNASGISDQIAMTNTINNKLHQIKSSHVGDIEHAVNDTFAIQDAIIELEREKNILQSQLDTIKVVYANENNEVDKLKEHRLQLLAEIIESEEKQKIIRRQNYDLSSNNTNKRYNEISDKLAYLINEIKDSATLKDDIEILKHNHIIEKQHNKKMNFELNIKNLQEQEDLLQLQIKESSTEQEEKLQKLRNMEYRYDHFCLDLEKLINHHQELEDNNKLLTTSNKTKLQGLHALSNTLDSKKLENIQLELKKKSISYVMDHLNIKIVSLVEQHIQFDNKNIILDQDNEQLYLNKLKLIVQKSRLENDCNLVQETHRKSIVESEDQQKGLELRISELKSLTGNYKDKQSRLENINNKIESNRIIHIDIQSTITNLQDEAFNLSTSVKSLSEEFNKKSFQIQKQKEQIDFQRKTINEQAFQQNNIRKEIQILHHQEKKQYELVKNKRINIEQNSKIKINQLENSIAVLKIKNTVEDHNLIETRHWNRTEIQSQDQLINKTTVLKHNCDKLKEQIKRNKDELDNINHAKLKMMFENSRSSEQLKETRDILKKKNNNKATLIQVIEALDDQNNYLSIKNEKLDLERLTLIVDTSRKQNEFGNLKKDINKYEILLKEYSLAEKTLDHSVKQLTTQKANLTQQNTVIINNNTNLFNSNENLKHTSQKLEIGIISQENNHTKLTNKINELKDKNLRYIIQNTKLKEEHHDLLTTQQKKLNLIQDSFSKYERYITKQKLEINHIKKQRIQSIKDMEYQQQLTDETMKNKHIAISKEREYENIINDLKETVTKIEIYKEQEKQNIKTNKIKNATIISYISKNQALFQTEKVKIEEQTLHIKNRHEEVSEELRNINIRKEKAKSIDEESREVISIAIKKKITLLAEIQDLEIKKKLLKDKIKNIYNSSLQIVVKSA